MDGDINPHTARNSNSSSSLMNCSDHHQLNIIPSDDHVNQSCCDGGGGGVCEIDWVGLLSGSSLSNNFEMENKVGIMGDYEDNNHVVGGKEVGYGGGGKINTNKGKMVMGKRSSSSSMPRIAFQTRSAEDVLDDGYRWRKYGQKAVKHSTHPRSYYRCTHHTCNVKKQIQRHSKDPAIVVTTYEGIHNHPSEKLMETLSPLLKQLQFLSGI